MGAKKAADFFQNLRRRPGQQKRASSLDNTLFLPDIQFLHLAPFSAALKTLILLGFFMFSYGNALNLEMLYETDNYRASCENKKRKEKLSKRQRKIIEKLCSVIKEVYGKKYLVLLDTDQGAYRVWEKIRLDRYGQEGNFFEDAHVENELMKLMDKGGLAVLVVGHGGLTPKRLYGVELHGGGFKRLKEAELEKLRSLVTAENKRASLDGNLRGCPEAFVEQSALLKHENI